MFDLLTSKISNVFSSLRKKGLITEEDLDKSLREIRISLLEADVALPVIKEFLSKVKEEAVGQQVYKSVSPVQMIIKIIHDKLVEILESSDKEAQLNTSSGLNVYMMVGLQGTGKTTSVGKLAVYLQKKLNKKVLVTSLDLQRAAAYEQLKTLANNNSVDFFEHNQKNNVVKIAKEAKKHAQDNNYDVLILDTAGRLNIEEELMQQLGEINNAVNAQEILLAVDAMVGQVAVNMAQDFNSRVPLTGVILTKVDGDARGGAALSVKYITGVPIKFMGVGETAKNLEVFDAKRIAGRILEQGDIVSFVEKIEDLQEEDEEELKGLSKRLSAGVFTMDDLKKQIRQIQKIGGIGGMMGMIPGLSSVKKKIKEAGVDSSVLNKQIALIDSMTKKERNKPAIINGSRKKRIASGAGSSVQEVNKILKQYEQASKMIKQINKGGMKNLAQQLKMGKNPFF